MVGWCHQHCGGFDLAHCFFDLRICFWRVVHPGGNCGVCMTRKRGCRQQSTRKKSTAKAYENDRATHFHGSADTGVQRAGLVRESW
jgi:hypothetical protein